MKKNDLITLNITDTGSGGEGVGRHENTVVFVRGAITGETVSVQITLVKPAFAVGRLLDILIVSPHRVKPRCTVFGECGGCAYQHCTDESALNAKVNAAQNTLKKTSGIGHIAIQNTVASDRTSGYRNKVSFPVRRTAVSDFEIGFFAAESNRVIAADDCPLTAFDCAKPLELIKRFMSNNRLKGYDASNGTGIRHIVMRQTDDCIMFTLVVCKNEPRIKDLDRELKEAYGEKYSLWLNINNQKSNLILGEKFIFIGGIKTPQITVLGINADVHPASFFQVNAYVRDRLYQCAVDALNHLDAGNAHDIVIDAYGGAGILSALVAKRTTSKVYTVEILKEACAAAEKLKKENSITNMEIICGDCAKELPKLLSGGNELRRIQNARTRVVLDPPRGGCDKTVLESIIDGGANGIVYISCNPASLGRDLGILCAHYNIESLTAFDMFPLTPHIEVMAILSRKGR